MCVDELISNTSMLVIPIAVSKPPEITFLGHNTVGVNVEAVSRVVGDLEGHDVSLLNVFVVGSLSDNIDDDVAVSCNIQ